MYYQRNEVMDSSEKVQSISRAGLGKVICGENRDILHILKWKVCTLRGLEHEKSIIIPIHPLPNNQD